MVYLAGVNVHGDARKRYGFAYFALPGHGGTTQVSYTQFKASQDITYTVPEKGIQVTETVAGPDGKTTRQVREYKPPEHKTITIPAGTVVPPEIVSQTNIATLKQWGFNPYKHMLPVKIPGLSRPEDLMKNPLYANRYLNDRLKEYVGNIDYKEYCKHAGIKLKKMVESDETKIAVDKAKSAGLSGTGFKTAEERYGNEVIKHQRTKKQLKKHKEQLAEKDQQLAQKDQQIAEKDQHIAQLKALLQKHGIDPEAS